MSGIYIPGMEMPRSCYICPFMKTNDDLSVEDYRSIYCDFPGIGEFVTDYEAARHPDCPLAPVPEHGRLIEWVSAKERLPEAGKPVLCACRANIYEVMKMRTDGSWVHNDAVYDSAYMGGFVTHWAELPTIIPADKEGE